ncbi:MAG: hypothetical protein AAGI23_09380 [Bacteroidota bacterium]
MEYGHISTYDGLQQWFLQAGTGKYSVYRGFIHGKLNNSQLYMKSVEFASAEDAFENLKQMLKLAGGGNFTIMIPSQSASMGVRTFFRLGGHSQVAGINGMQAVQGISATQVQEMIAKEREKWELSKRVEDLEAALEYQTPWFERIAERIAGHENLDRLLEIGLVRLMGGGGNPNPAQVGLAGYPPQAAAAPTMPDQQLAAQEQEQYYDGERIANSVQRIQIALPEQNIYEVLDALATFVERNPQVALQFLEQQKQKVAHAQHA